MNGPRLTGSELADLLFRRDGGGVLLSLCREAEAEYVTESGYLLRSACLRDHRGEPLPFRSSASFGSSDRDSLHTARQFLVKAE